MNMKVKCKKNYFVQFRHIKRINSFDRFMFVEGNEYEFVKEENRYIYETGSLKIEFNKELFDQYFEEESEVNGQE